MSRKKDYKDKSFEPEQKTINSVVSSSQKVKILNKTMFQKYIETKEDKIIIGAKGIITVELPADVISKLENNKDFKIRRM
jgi:hypothetical protein